MSMNTNQDRGSGIVESLGPRLFLRGADGYETVRQGAVWRANKPARFPEAIVMAESDQDAVAAVHLARERGWKVGTRSGGHGWSSAHIRDGALLIDLSRMQNITFDPNEGTVSVNPSVKGRRINEEIAQYGRMFPGGHHSSVGVGGFVMCGGWGWNARQWGNGSQQIIELDVVTADGELITANESQNADYLWAARGSGPGFFGVVTRFKLATYPMPKAMRRTVHIFGKDDVGELVAWCRDVVDQVPRNVEMIISAASSSESGGWAPLRVVLSAIAFTDTAEDAHTALAFMSSLPISDRASVRKIEVPFTLMEGYTFGTAVDPEGMRYACDNIYTNAPGAVLTKRLEELFTTLPSPYSHIFWLNWGPAWPWPDMALSIQGDIYIAVYSVWDDAADDESMEKWPVDQMRKLEDISVGSQLNDENMKARPSRYLSEAASAKLEALRAKYDRDHLFVSYLRSA